MLDGIDNYYSLLRIPRDATRAEIRQAYHEAALRYHPDTNDDTLTAENFLQIQQAFETLSNPSRREAYDFRFQPTDPPPNITINTYMSRSAIAPLPDPQLLYVLIDLEVKVVNMNRPPLNLCILVDKSNSMRGRRMDVVKETARQLAKKLRPQDYLSIVAFSDRAEVIIPAGRNVDEKRINVQLSMLQPSGATEIFQGLREGFRQVNRNRKAGNINHIIMITDGHTYGDESLCLGLARNAGNLGVRISGLGIGSEWNDEFLDELTSLTGGTTLYVRSVRDIKRFLEFKFGELNRTVAENVRLLVSEQNEKFVLRYAFRLQPDPSKLEGEKKIYMGDIRENQPQRVLLEFLVENISSAADHLPIMDSTIWMEIPSRTVPTVRENLNLRIKVGREAGKSTMPAEINQALSRLNLYRMQERAQEEMDAGDYESATRRLKNLASQLLGQGELGLATNILKEASLVEKGTATTNSEFRKEVKYGTRALLLPPGEGYSE